MDLHREKVFKIFKRLVIFDPSSPVEYVCFMPSSCSHLLRWCHPRHFLAGLAMTLLAGSALPGNAAPLVGKASEDFEWQYQATVLPNQVLPAEENWILRTGGTQVPAASASIVHGTHLQISAVSGNHLYYEARPPNWRNDFESALGFTLELKVRVDPGTTFGVNLAFDEGATVLGAGRAPILRIDAAGTSWQVNSGSTTIFETIHTARNDDGYHLFRLVKLPSSGSVAGAYNIYRDGVLIAENIAGANANMQGLDRFFFGAIGSALAGTDVSAQVEWVRWDASGAFQPVPEPGTMALLVAGGLLLAGSGVAHRRRWKQGGS